MSKDVQLLLQTLATRLKQVESENKILTRRVNEIQGITDANRRPRGAMAYNPVTPNLMTLDMAIMKITYDAKDGTYSAKRQIATNLGVWIDHPTDTTTYNLQCGPEKIDGYTKMLKINDIVLARFDGMHSNTPMYQVYFGSNKGTHTNPQILGPSSYTATTAATDTWDITAQGTDGNGTPYDGVVLKWPYRVVWSSPNLKAFTRQCTYDSAGNLVLVSAETETTIVTFVECTTTP